MEKGKRAVTCICGCRERWADALLAAWRLPCTPRARCRRKPPWQPAIDGKNNMHKSGTGHHPAGIISWRPSLPLHDSYLYYYRYVIDVGALQTPVYGNLEFLSYVSCTRTARHRKDMAMAGSPQVGLSPRFLSISSLPSPSLFSHSLPPPLHPVALFSLT